MEKESRNQPKGPIREVSSNRDHPKREYGGKRVLKGNTVTGGREGREGRPRLGRNKLGLQEEGIKYAQTNHGLRLCQIWRTLRQGTSEKRGWGGWKEEEKSECGKGSGWGSDTRKFSLEGNQRLNYRFNGGNWGFLIRESGGKVGGGSCAFRQGLKKNARRVRAPKKLLHPISEEVRYEKDKPCWMAYISPAAS